MAHRKKKIGAQLVEDEEYQLRYERVAGIDVAKGKADVCTRLPPAARAGGGCRGPRRSRRPDRGRDGAGRRGCSRTGWSWCRWNRPSDYWRIWFYVLEAAGLNVQLVNSSHARQLAGRPKTDRLDAQWLARLTEMGLLRPSFVPPPEIRALRDLTRTRLQLVRDRTREWQRLEKLLEGALVKLSSALSSLASQVRPGHPGGPRRRRARPPGAGGLAARQVRAGRAGIEQALEGMLYGDHHGKLTRTHLDHITFLDRSSPRSRTTSPRPWTPSPPRRASTPPATGPPTPGPDAAVPPGRGAARGDPRRQPGPRPRHHRRNGPGHDPVPHRRAPRQPGPGYPRRPPVRPPQPQAGRATATSTCAATAPRPPPAPRRPTPSSANGSAACPRRLGGNRARCAVARSILVIVWHLLAAPTPGSPTSAPAGTPARPTPTAAPAASSTSSAPSTPTPTSPSPRQPPKTKPPPTRPVPHSATGR